MKDRTETIIEIILTHLRTLPKEQAMAFAEELIFAVSIESGSRHEAVGILEWAKDTVINEYKHKAEEPVRDFFVEKSMAEN